MMMLNHFEDWPSESHPYQKLISESGYVDKIYEALSKDDPSEAVITAMNVLKSTSSFDFTTEKKSEDWSNLYRNEGNRFYFNQRFRPALECYNRALLYAPNNSQSMKLAYSNRSALLFTIKAYTACINDIDTYFSMGSTDRNISQRLRQRKNECLQHAWLDNIKLFENDFAGRYFKFNVKRNPQIPCASTDVNVLMESGLPKIVAARDISIGRLVAVETPFVSELDADNYNISCHYCHRLSFNLIPCDGCCVALFCDEQCRSNCKKEYHNIECKIMVPHRIFDNVSASTLKLRAALKIKQMCKSWKDLIAASYHIGEERMRSSTISEVYDVKSKLSLLSHNNPSSFVHGKSYNQSFICAMDLQSLANLDDFFPKEAGERDAAIRAFARIMMHLYTSYRKIEIYNGAKDPSSGDFTSNTERNFGWFSFTGKLRHSCNPNLMILGIKNKIALIAIRPIKKGDELTISFLGHYCESVPANRQRKLYCFTQQTCSCQVCVDKWSMINLKKLKLTSGQRKVYSDWSAIVENRMVVVRDRDEHVFKTTCEAMTAFKDAERSTEYYEMFRELQKVMTFCQCVFTNNQFVQKDDEEVELLVSRRFSPSNISESAK